MVAKIKGGDFGQVIRGKDRGKKAPSPACCPTTV